MRRLAALACLLLATSADAVRRDVPGRRHRRAPAVPRGWAAGADTSPALRVNGQVIDLGTYRRALADGEASWTWLREMHSEDVILKGGLTRQEFIVTAELAEPLAVKSHFGAQAKDHERLAWEAYERAKRGDDWNLLVETYATEPGARRSHGDLGVVAFDNLVHPFNRVMFAAPVGQVQPPVQTIFGYHVGKVTEVLPPRDITRNDGTVVRRPETRRVSQILIVWDVGEDEEGGTSDLRLELMDLPKRLSVEVLDRSLCGELPHWCERAAPAPGDAPQGGS